MLKNYIKIAFRSLLKYRLYSTINVLGLAIALGACMLMFLFVKDEMSFDSFHENADNIYRVHINEHYESRDIPNTVGPYVLGPTIEASIPEVEGMTRINRISNQVKEGEFFDQEAIHMVEPDFFQIFDFPVIKGEKNNPLSDLKQVVITREIAEKYFGDQNPVGEPLSLLFDSEYEDFLVTAVLENPPTNSSLQFGMLIPLENIYSRVSERARNNWYSVSVETYVTLKNGTDPKFTEEKFPGMMKQALGDDYEEGAYEVGLQPLTDIHLNAEMPQGMVPVSDWRYSYILGGIALLILIVACINFMTLAVGRSIQRAREVGIRKVVGARRRQLMAQFWSEAIIVSFISALFGVLIAEIAMPLFNQLSGKELTIEFSLVNIIGVILLAIIVGLISGAYPAAILSGFAPIRVLKGVQKHGRGRKWVMQTLVGAQFVLSIVLIASTFIMRDQVYFLQNKNLGYDKEHVMVVQYQPAPRPGFGISAMFEEGREKAGILKNELSRNAEIIDLTVSMHTFGEAGWMQVGYNDEEGAFRSFQVNAIDYEYLQAMGMKVIVGRDFDRKNSLDRNSGVIVNQAMLDRFNIENPISSTLPKPFNHYQIVGVVNNFHFASLRDEISPLAMVVNPLNMLQSAPDISFGSSPNPKISVRFKTSDLPGLITKVENTWKEVVPEQTFAFQFLDETLQQQYTQENRLRSILTASSVLAILIACMGLFGIVALNVSNRTKEISVRKVLGASTENIVFMLVSSFTKLTLIAFAIAIPVSWILMDDWLSDFSYRITIGPKVFLLTGGTILLLTWITVSYQSIRAALADPVDAIKDE